MRKGHGGKKGSNIVDAVNSYFFLVCVRQLAPDALDKSRDAVHRVAVVRHDAAHAPLHVHQPPVAAREQQMSALALAVVGEGDLCLKHVRKALCTSRCEVCDNGDEH